MLEQLARMLLAAFPTTMQQDRELLYGARGRALSSEEQLAVSFRCALWHLCLHYDIPCSKLQAAMDP